MSSAYRVLFLSLFIDGSEVTCMCLSCQPGCFSKRLTEWLGKAGLFSKSLWAMGIWVYNQGWYQLRQGFSFDVREHVSTYSHQVYSLIIKHPGYLINYSPLARGWRIWLMSQWHLLCSLYSVTSMTSGKIYPTCILYSRVSGLLLITGNGPPSSRNVLQGNSTDALKEQIINVITLYCVHK